MNRIRILSVKDVVPSQSRPYIVMGEDFEVYYCKFAVGSCDEVDLYYEYVCKSVGTLLGLPIPDASLMEYEPDLFVEQFPILGSSLLGFGSKEIRPNQILAEKTDFINNKHDFNRISNPEALIKIGIFDLHFKNMDRSDANFNLIRSTGTAEPSKIYAIDHVQCFGGDAYKDSLHPVREDSIGANILRTDYGTAICRYLGYEDLSAILIEYFNTFNIEKDSIVERLNESPSDWGISDSLKHRVETFVFDSSRNESIMEEMKAYFTHF